MTRRLIAVTLVLALLAGSRSSAQYAPPRSSSEIKLALDHLTVLGSVLYVAAHPDDENTAFLAAMARGRGMRTGYLSLTRGEGGQNLIGPEQGAALGLIRTQELLAARSVDGAAQFFTRAIDFGYSKSTEETLRFWDRESTLADMVRVIRMFQPDIVVTRFTPLLGGHGNHTASGLLAGDAVEAAADPDRFTSHSHPFGPWKVRRLFWNVFRAAPAETTGTPGTIPFDVGTYSPLLGRSFTELAGIGRTMHKSQGFGSSQMRGETVNLFRIIRGDTASSDLFDGIPAGWDRIPGGENIAFLVAAARNAYTVEEPSRCVPHLLRLSAALGALPGNPAVAHKRAQTDALIQACAGLWSEFTTPRPDGCPGSGVNATVMAVNRSAEPFVLERITLPFKGKDTLLNLVLEPNRPVRIPADFTIPDTFPPQTPYWLHAGQAAGRYHVEDPGLIGLPEAPEHLVATLHLSHPAGTLALAVPLRTKTVDPVEGEVYDPFPVVPPVSLDIREKVLLFPADSSRKLHVALRAAHGPVSGTLRLTLPAGWKATPESLRVSIGPSAGDSLFAFVLTPPPQAAAATVEARFVSGGGTMSSTIRTVAYRHIPRQTWLDPAVATLLRAPVRSPGGTAGYIMGAGDEVPAAMAQLGYRVTLLSDADLAGGDLSAYDVIVAGIRAYNTRDALRTHHARLMEYVERGGTCIVQYVTPARGEADHIGPFPLRVSRERVAEEDAPVEFTAPGHRILTTPNAITRDDFRGWVQERGLSFADQWDARYATVLSSHDTGEPDRRGGLLVARHGKGTYLYTGYAFFRQLPAGNAGAYRLFANILALHDARHQKR